jgi:hypothetical protein
MKTTLYLPILDFTINDANGELALYKTLVQSGPSYKLVVHESPQWHKICEEIAGFEDIIILSQKDADHYKDLANKFFSPITEEASPYYFVDGQTRPIANLTSDLRCALSWILIAHDYKARIYDDEIFDVNPNVSSSLQSSGGFSDEAINRAKFVENLLAGYQKNSVDTLSVNKDPEILTKLMNIMDKEEIKDLSCLNYKFGELRAEKNKLKRDVEQKLTEIIKNEWFPEMVGLAAVGISYYPNLATVGPAIGALSAIGAKVLSRFDFREYSPPIEDVNLFTFARPQADGVVTSSYKSFNREYSFFVRKL